MDGGIEYVNGLTADTASIVTGIYPDQYGVASFTANINNYISANFDLSVILMLQDQGSAPANDIHAAHVHFASTADNAGWALFRPGSLTTRFTVLDNNLPLTLMPDTEVIGRKHTDIFFWDGNATSGSRFIYWDQDATGSRVTSSIECPSMGTPPAPVPFVVGSNAIPAQLVIVTSGINMTVGQRQSLFDNIWGIILQPGTDHDLVIENLTVQHTLADTILDISHALVIENLALQHSLDEPALIQTRQLVTESLTIQHVLDEPQITGVEDLTIEDLTINYMLDTVILGFDTFCLTDAEQELDKGVVVNAEGAGLPVTEIRYDQINRKFMLHWDGLSSADMLLIFSFVEINSHTPFIYTWYGDDYLCIIEVAPTANMIPGGEWSVEIVVTVLPDGV